MGYSLKESSFSHTERHTHVQAMGRKTFTRSSSPWQLCGLLSSTACACYPSISFLYTWFCSPKLYIGKYRFTYCSGLRSCEFRCAGVNIPGCRAIIPQLTQFNPFTFFALTQLHNLIYIWKRLWIMCGKYLPEHILAEDSSNLVPVQSIKQFCSFRNTTQLTLLKIVVVWFFSNLTLNS